MQRWLVFILLGVPCPTPAMPVLDLASAAELARAGACVAVSLDPGGSFLYQANSGAAGVDGVLAKYPLARDARGQVVIAAQPVWNAAAQLDARDPATRLLYTGRRDGAHLATIALDWQALDQAQRQLLSNAGDTLGPLRLAYLRGERLQEAGRPGGLFRRRDSLLGATVVGAPLLVAAPVVAGDDTGRAGFVAAVRSRPEAVYLQANDGMVHAFDAASGAELFAYLPQALQSYWPRLVTSAHAAGPYAEGALAAGDALVRGAWKTVLAGALGSAAQGVFALDISDPGRFAQGAGVLFEFTDQDDPDIGNVFGAPAVARFLTAAGQYGDFVVAASGYNNNRADGEGRFNQSGPGVLFLLSLDKDPASAWQLNRNYFKFTLPAASGARANGLAQPALVAGADGSVRAAFAGDLQGQVWRLDFGFGQPPWPAATGMPLFAASDAAGKRQPITMQLRAVYAERGLLLLFGTGRLLDAADAQDKSFQTFYAVSDQTGSERTASRDDLAKRQRVADGAGGFRLDSGVGSANGWLLDFPVAGERMIASPLTLDGNVYLATIQPGAVACTPAAGLYLLDAQTGQPPAGVATSWLGMPTAPGRSLALASEAAPGQPGAAAQAGTAARNTVVSGGVGKPALSVVQKTRAGRLGWREVMDWEAMRNAMQKK